MKKKKNKRAAKIKAAAIARKHINNAVRKVKEKSNAKQYR
tara:strand:- start:1794 stop:1913 length:120 start_codon:yes stop_codon:yes gene_type:complete